MTDHKDSNNLEDKKTKESSSNSKKPNTSSLKGKKLSPSNNKNHANESPDKSESDKSQKIAETLNDTDEPISESRISKSKEQAPKELFSAKAMPKMASKKLRKKWLVPVLISFLLIICLIVSGWTVYQQYQFNQDWAEIKNKMDATVNQQNQTIVNATNSGHAAMQAANQSQLKINQLAAENKQLRDSLLSTQEKIKALSGRQKQDWMLAEAAYLIKNAQLKLSLQRDKLTAIQLLKAADRLITEIADNKLLPIRKAIAKDLSDLSLIVDVDVTGIAVALNAISQQIPHLNSLSLQFEALQESNKIKEEEIEGFDLSKIYQDFLKDFVHIKEHGAVKPLMTASQRANLNANIQLAIQQAQIALVQNNSGLYRLNIENAIQWIVEFFKQDDAVLQMAKQLKTLQTEPIEIHYPNQLNAQTSLDEVSREQLYHWLEKSSYISPVHLKNNAVPLPVVKNEPETREPVEELNRQNEKVKSDQNQNMNQNTNQDSQSFSNDQQSSETDVIIESKPRQQAAKEALAETALTVQNSQTTMTESLESER